MKRQALFLIAAAILSATVASAQIRAMTYVPSAPSAGLGAAAVTAVMGANSAPAIPILPAAAAAPVMVAAPVAAPVAAVPAALESVRALTDSIFRYDAAPALSAAFDGRLSAPSVPVEAAPAAPRTPENFARKAEELFTAGRLAPGQRAQVAWKDAPHLLGMVPTDKELYDRMARSPLTNAEREKVIIELFKLGGAKPEEIVVSDLGRGQNNILVVKKGRTDRVIVVGGHHDKVRQGAGTIDNWTGATLVTNLYQSLRDQDTDATIVFISFGREEDGLIGSARYLESLSKAQRAKIDAMVNLDTLAVDGTFSWKNNSTRALLDRIKTVAAASKHDLTEAALNGGDADSSTFRRAGIAAMTIFGASQDVIFDIIHSENDTMAAFSLDHYRNAFLLALELLKSLDREKLGPVGRAGA
ncbi:MAG: M28 family peptidase [Elusimicrobiota bacterium]